MSGTTVTLEANPKPGFYKSGNTYIQCKNYGFCEVVTPTGDCTDDNTGKLIKKGSDVALCLGNFAPPEEETATTPSKRAATTATLPTLAFGAATDHYLVKHVPGDNVFSFAKNANFYAITCPDANSIVLDSDYGDDDEPEKDKAALKNDGKLIDRQDELCDIGNSSGRYYSCKYGVCTSTKKTSKDPESNDDSQGKK